MAKEKLACAVVGEGHIGGTLGKKWSVAGHEVRFGVNDPAGKNAQTLRTETDNHVMTGTIEDVLQGNPDVVLIALPGGVVEMVAQKYPAKLIVRILIVPENRLGEN